MDLSQDLDGDPEVTIILRMIEEMSPEIDVENVNMKEEEKNKLSGDE